LGRLLISIVLSSFPLGGQTVVRGQAQNFRAFLRNFDRVTVF